MSVDEANHAIGEEARFDTDFYDYLASPENATRYTPAADYLYRRYRDSPYSLLDVGCGNAAFAQHALGAIRYVGIDHSQSAISDCAAAYPEHSFICDDAVAGLENLARERRRFDAVLMCGFLFHVVDKSSLAKKSDADPLRFALQNVLEPDGVLIVIAPFAFRDNETYSLLEQAAWKLATVESVLEDLPVRRVHQVLAVQFGVEHHVASQAQTPDWFVPPEDESCENRYSGHYLASWTLVLTNPNPPAVPSEES